MLQLPTEILEEILSRLRVKDLIQFKSVCKTWLRVISSQHLIQRHLNKSIYRAIHIDSLVVSPCSRLIRSSGIVSRDYYMNFVGSCDGLVCRYDEYHGIIHISNPATRKAACVPAVSKFEPPDSVSCFWFGRGDDLDNEYKLLIGTSSHMHLTRPYIDNGSWISKQEFGKKYSLCEMIGTLYNGTVHWAVAGEVWSSVVILSYDLRKETIGEIRGPDIQRSHKYFSIGEVDGCFSALLINVDFELWGMKEYGVTESWTKLMRFPSGVVLNYLYVFSKNRPELLLDDPAAVRSPLYRKTRYVESLVSPLRSGDSCGAICHGN